MRTAFRLITMIDLGDLALLGAGLLFVYTVYHFVIRSRFSPLADLPGPPFALSLLAHPGTMGAKRAAGHIRLAEEYPGGVVRYQGHFGEPRLLITDPTALNAILVTHSYDYPKPNEARGMLSRALGEGILFSEGEDHKRQKRIMAKAFSPIYLKSLTPTFFEVAYRLRDAWSELVETSGIDEAAFKNEAAKLAYVGTRKGDQAEAVIEVSRWTNRATLDIIGLTGFGHSFNSLESLTSPLGAAIARLTGNSVASAPSGALLLIGRIVRGVIMAIPVLQYLPFKTLVESRKTVATINRECTKIVEARKIDLSEELKSGRGGHDLISLLLKSNMESDPKNKMSDAELQGQVTTLVLAGSETTSNALTWTLWNLARHPEIQDRLRAEVRLAKSKALEEGRDDLNHEELNSLAYLEAVTREVLRYDCPVPSTTRIAHIDATIPLSKPITTVSGKTISSFFLPKGTIISVSIAAANRSTAIFGKDASVFRPERWLDGSVSDKAATTGVYAHLMSFLAGPRACIGWKFAISEYKVLLSVLIDEFHFGERDGTGPAIARRSGVVMRSLVVGEEELGVRMPLVVTKAKGNP